MGVLKGDIYYIKSSNDFYLWTEEKEAEKIQQLEKKDIYISQDFIYLEDKNGEKGNLYFRPENGEDANQEGKTVLLMENTDMEYLIFDENSRSDYLVGWTSKYRGEKENTTLIDYYSMKIEKLLQA